MAYLAAAAAAAIVAAVVAAAVVTAAAENQENQNDAAAAAVVTEEIDTFASFRLQYILLRKEFFVNDYWNLSIPSKRIINEFAQRRRK